MLDAANIRVCSVVHTHVSHRSACHDTALPLRLAPEEKRLTCKHSFSCLSEVDPLLCRGLCAQMARSLALLLMVFYCFRAVPLESRAKEKYREISRWPVTHAVFQSASVSTTSFSWRPKKIRYCPDREHGYSVAGRAYTNRNQIFDFSC